MSSLDTEVQPRMLKPSVPLPGPCWGMSWEATCRHKGRAVIVPLLFPLSLSFCSSPSHASLAKHRAPSLVVYYPLQSLFNPQARSGLESLSDFFESVTGGPFQSGSGGQKWKSYSVPLLKAFLLSLCSALLLSASEAEVGFMCVFSNIHDGEFPWGFTVVIRFSLRLEINQRLVDETFSF